MSRESLNRTAPWLVLAAAVAAHCLWESGVMIGRTNRSFPKYNNTLCLSPALICTRGDLDEIAGAIDRALTAQSA